MSWLERKDKIGAKVEKDGTKTYLVPCFGVSHAKLLLMNLSVGLNGRWVVVRYSMFSLFFVSRFNIDTVFNLTVVAVFTLIIDKHTVHPNPP